MKISFYGSMRWLTILTQLGACDPLNTTWLNDVIFRIKHHHPHAIPMRQTDDTTAQIVN